MNELTRTTNTEVLVRKLATKTNKTAAECLQEHSWNRPDEPQCGLPPAQLPEKKRESDLHHMVKVVAQHRVGIELPRLDTVYQQTWKESEQRQHTAQPPCVTHCPHRSFIKQCLTYI